MNNQRLNVDGGTKSKMLSMSLILGLVILMWLGLAISVNAENSSGLDDILSKGDFKTQKLGYELLAGHKSLVIQAEPRNKSIAKTLGYSQIRAWYDMVDQLTRKIVLLDANGNQLSTVVFVGLNTIKGKKRAAKMEVTNHITGQTCSFDMGAKSSLAQFM